MKGHRTLSNCGLGDVAMEMTEQGGRSRVSIQAYSQLVGVLYLLWFKEVK